MKISKKDSASGEKSEYFQRARWKHWLHLFGFTVILLLNFSLIQETLQLSTDPRAHTFVEQLPSLLLLLLVDLTMLPPIIFEVDKLIATSDKLIVNTLLWQAKIPWDAIVAIWSPIYMAYAVVRTKRCFYLINKRDIQPFTEVLEILQRKAASKD